MARGITKNGTWVSVALGAAMLAGMTTISQGSRAQTPEAMTQARTEEVMGAYVEALLSNGSFADYFADDVVVTFVDVGQEIVGRDAAEQAIVDFHQVAFATAPEVQTFIAGPGIAYAEVLFVATHTGDFAGIPATGREVSVPYVAVWELSGDKITALRLYGPASGLIQLLTTEGTPAGSTPSS
ncbi:MAG: nuclear transport factor 2 family protein [Chloroflexia bacterium]|nr:nuclear transport factor 2 family protein [Chloroflexia bacterium]